MASACTRLGDLAASPVGDFSPTRAIQAYLDGCDHGDPAACLAVAAIADELGYPDRVRTYRHRACGLSGAPCRPERDPQQLVPPLSWMLDAEAVEASAPVWARSLYDRACNAGLARACLRAGRAADALAVLRRRCEQSWTSACAEAGQLAGDQVWLAPSPHPR